MHKSQVLAVLVVSFLIGVAVASEIHFSNSVILGLLGAGVFVIAVSGYRAHRGGFLAGCAIIACALGIVRFTAVDAERGILAQFADVQVGGRSVPFTVRGYVDSDGASDSSREPFILRVVQVVAGSRAIPAQGRILVTPKADHILAFGDPVAVTGAISTPQNFSTFDYITYLKKEGIAVVMNNAVVARDSAPLALSPLDRARWVAYRPIFRLKRNFERAVIATVPRPYAAYLDGVLVGARADIPADIIAAFQRTGTTHILAISGYNIAVIADAVMAILVLAFPRRRAMWGTLAVIILFTIMTGASASVARAAVMGLLVLGAAGYGRLYDAGHAVLLAAGVMVALNPFLLAHDAGFQLSFLAVLGLIYIYPILDRASSLRITIPSALKETALMTLAAQIATLPLILGLFGTLSLVSLPANVLVLPLMPALMLAGFLAGALGMAFLPLGKAAGLVAWGLAKYQLAVITWLSSLPAAAVSVHLSWPIIVALYIAIIAAVWKYSHASGPASRTS